MAIATFKYKNSTKQSFSEGATVLNLNYSITPKVLEMHELLRQNSSMNLEAIISSTNKVQRYIYNNRKQTHDPNWEVLLLAQRKWLAIRLILEQMGEQSDQKSERLRLSILESLELADVRDMVPMAEKLPNYRTAEEYLNVLRTDPARATSNTEVAELFFKNTSRKHFNQTIYSLALSSTIRQWVTMQRLYGWVILDKDFEGTCAKFCSEEDLNYSRSILEKMFEQSIDNSSTDIESVNEAYADYVSAINKIYPDPRNDPAVFKNKFVIAGNTIDYEKSSDEYKNAYQTYSRRYDLVFSQPHGLLMGTSSFINQMGSKRSPTDVRIFSQDGETKYEWKMHPNVQVYTINNAILELFNGIYRQLEQTHKLKRDIDQQSEDSGGQIKITSDFADQFQFFPIAKALLIRPDYAFLMNEVFDKYTRIRPEVITKWTLNGISIALGVAAVAFLLPFTPAIIPSTMFLLSGAASIAGVGAAAMHLQQSNILAKRVESSLFSDSLGTNFSAFQNARKEYYKARRDLYITAGITALEAAAFARTGWHIYKTGKGVNILKNMETVKQGYVSFPNAFKYFKNCSSPYCRKFLQTIPLITENADGNNTISLLGKLNKATNLEDFENIVKNSMV